MTAAALSRRHALEASLVFLSGHNVAQNTVLNERGYVTGNLAVSGMLVGLGRMAGLEWEDMGLTRGDARRTARAARWAGVGSGIEIASVLLTPRLRRLFRDERARPGSIIKILERTLVRFPWGTALFEEVAFRGVLPALLLADGDEQRADRLAAAAFGLWHVIPTTRALRGNPSGEHKSAPARIAIVAGGCVAAGVSGLGFSWLRRTSGTLAAPWAVHALVNGSMYLAGVLAHLIDDDAGSDHETVRDR